MTLLLRYVVNTAIVEYPVDADEGAVLKALARVVRYGVLVELLRGEECVGGVTSDGRAWYDMEAIGGSR